MIITDINKIGKLPVGTEFTYKVRVRVQRVLLSEVDPCEGCIFRSLKCPECLRNERDDGEEVKFIKI